MHLPHVPDAAPGAAASSSTEAGQEHPPRAPGAAASAAAASSSEAPAQPVGEGGDVLAAAERATSAMAGVVEAKLLAFDAGS